LDKFKQMVIDAGKKMASEKLTIGTWGNISVRDSEEGYIFVTPSGMEYDSCTCADIVVFDKEGNWAEGERRPTTEKNLHIMIYRQRKDINAIIHTHPLYSMTFAVAGQPVPAVTEEFAQIVGYEVKCAGYALPGTDELAQKTVDSLGQNNAVLLENHGAVCVGDNMAKAFRVAEVLEKTAHILILCKSIGLPKIISSEEVKVLQAYVRESYGQK